MYSVMGQWFLCSEPLKQLHTQFRLVNGYFYSIDKPEIFMLRLRLVLIQSAHEIK